MGWRVSLLVMAGLLGIPWTIWGWWHRSRAEVDMTTWQGFRWRVAFSAVSVPATLLLLIGWLYI